MSPFLFALAAAALPALGNFLGGMLAEMVALSNRTLSLALHGAAGIILAVVGIELMPRALQAEAPWIVVLAFVAGGGLAVLLDKTIEHIRCRFAASGGEGGPWMIYAGVAVDLFSDGIMIGTGATIGTGLALLLALGQMSGDFPEGFATIATFRKKGVPRAKRLLIAASFAIPILLGTTIGYWAMRGQPEIYKLALLALTAGILTAIAVEEMIVEAHEATREAGGETAGGTLALVGGFGLFALISAYLD